MQFPFQIVAQLAKDDTQMVEIGAKALRANGISFVLFSFHTVYSLLFLTLGKGKEEFILKDCRQGDLLYSTHIHSSNNNEN